MALWARLPPGLARLVAHCLEKDPERRLQSSLDLRNALADLRDSGEPLAAPPPSVAVLPFVDMSREQDQGYFCEGMAEEILAALAGVEGLRVASRTSSFVYRGASLPAGELGRRLQVGHLVEGSLRKAGHRLRISAQLTDVLSGYQLWSARFERDDRDVFAVQDEIAQSIARALKVTLGPALRPAPTTDLAAYDLYLQGRHLFFQYTRRAMVAALQRFERAIELDPRFARAYAGVAKCCAYLYIYADRRPVNLERAAAMSAQALALDPGLADAHAARGVVLSAEGRSAEAEAAFETAMRLDPRLFEGPYLYARHCFAAGELEKAIELFERAAEVRPEDYQSPLLVAQLYDSLGRPAEAEKVRRRGLALVEERLRWDPEDARALYMGANARVALGDRDAGLAWARSARRLAPEDPMLLYNLGCIHALAGEPEEALTCLEMAVQGGMTQKEWLLHDGDLVPLRGLPRFRALIDRMG